MTATVFARIFPALTADKQRGVAASGSAIGNVFTHPEGEERRKQIDSVKKWIRHAAVMEAPRIRCHMPGRPIRPIPVSEKVFGDFHIWAGLEELTISDLF